MGYFLNIVYGDFDNIRSDNYLNPDNRPTKDDKLNFLQKIVGDSQKLQLRLFSLDDLYTFRSELSYYIVSELKDIKIGEDECSIHKLPIDEKLRNVVLTQKNLNIIFLKKEGSDLSTDSLNFLIEKSKVNPERYILINENEFNLEFLTDLTLKKIKNTFNVVYDTWSDDHKSFKPNLSNYSKRGDKYRFLEGLFRFYGYYNDIRNCHINEIHINRNENFYYFINCDIMHDEFNESFDIPENLKQIHRQYSNFNIVLLNEHEFETKDFIEKIDNYLIQDNMDPTRIYMWNNNSKLEKYKNEIGTDINVYSLEFLVKFISDHMVNFPNQPTFKTNKVGPFFLCHNRGPKLHRYALLCLLKKHKILFDTDWSLILGWYKKTNLLHNDEKIFYNPIFDDDDYELYKEEIEYFKNIDIKKSLYEESKDWFDSIDEHAQVNWKNVYEIDTYENTHVNIVTESCYERYEVHITEKSVKPFYFYQLPVFLSSYNHVKYLKDRFGFDMFDDLIDHSYDDEIDNKKRLFLVFEQIKNLYDNKQKVIEFYNNNKERFIENHNKVLNIYNSKKDIEYFNFLANKNL